MEKNPELDRTFSDARLWRREAEALREILLESSLTEERKWGKPCYNHDGKNICIIQRMNDFLALLYFKGALLNDPAGVLEVQGPHSRSGYRIRFTCVQDVARLKKSVETCIRDAIDIEKTGSKVERTKGIEYPDELIDRFSEDTDFKEAFNQLTPGRQRGYVLHFISAKQSGTRVVRIENSRSRILEGKGFNER